MVSEFGSRLQHCKYTLYQSSYITQNFGGLICTWRKNKQTNKHKKKTLSAITLSPSTHCSSDVAAWNVHWLLCADNQVFKVFPSESNLVYRWAPERQTDAWIIQESVEGIEKGGDGHHRTKWGVRRDGQAQTLESEGNLTLVRHPSLSSIKILSLQYTICL